MSSSHHAQLARRLTPRDRWLIRMLHEHRVLTTATVQTLAFPSGRSTRERLLELHDWDVVDRFQPLLSRGSAPMHYVLGAAGAAVLAAEEGLTVQQLGYRRDEVLSIAHRPTLAHTVAVNDHFANLIAAARQGTAATALARLSAWWSERRCLRYIGDLVRPDAYGSLDLASRANRVSEWFLELDFGTEPLNRLAAKLEGYAQLAAIISTRPRAHPGTVTVLVWLPGRRREANAREHLTHALRGLDQPQLVRIATASPPPALTDAGPEEGLPPGADDVWQPLPSVRTSADDHYVPTRAPRCGIVELAHQWASPGPIFRRFVEDIPARSARIVDLPAPDPSAPRWLSR